MLVGKQVRVRYARDKIVPCYLDIDDATSLEIADRLLDLIADLVAAGPLLSADGSDSQSLDEALELLVASGWDLGTALLTAMPEATASRAAMANCATRSASAPPPAFASARNVVPRVWARSSR